MLCADEIATIFIILEYHSDLDTELYLNLLCQVSQLVTVPLVSSLFWESLWVGITNFVAF